ncbi:hypothetical protein GGR52DRAFT_583955 [Hypoxylon sp. FL1284]|nr:hypothetical protein GGR52DRAFT_583955 [Hypoxylon sp. FL1284]
MAQEDQTSPQQKACPFQDRPRLRWAFLIGLVVLVVAVLVVGVVFTVYYDALYYSTGAFLVKQKGYQDGFRADVSTATTTAMPEAHEALAMQSLPRAARDRTRAICDDDVESCEAYNKSNICCPAGMSCHATQYSASGVYCCARDSSASSSPSLCVATEARPARCGGHARACGKSLGGGCCEPGSRCAASGCLRVYRAAPGFATGPLLTGTQTPPPLPSAAETETGGVTVTAPKTAETALQSGAAECRFGFSSGAAMLEVLALVYAVVLGG